MSDSAPRRMPMQYGVPINEATGEPLTPHQQIRLAKLTDAAETLYAVMHESEGSAPPGEHQEHTWSSRRMAIAATHLETALLFARKAALEAP